jgi:hypothetical protein
MDFRIGAAGSFSIGNFEIETTGQTSESLKRWAQDCKDADPIIAEGARLRLATQTEPEAMDAVCALWIAKREEIWREIMKYNSRSPEDHKKLLHSVLYPEYDVWERAVKQGGYVAQQPLIVRMMSALLVGRIEAVTDAGTEIAPMLVRACTDIDLEIRENAHRAMAQMKSAETREAICQEVFKINPGDYQSFYELLVRAQYAPQDPYQRAFFFFMSEQWEKYESLDFDHRLLRATYEAGDHILRGRIAKKARQAGRVEWIEIVGGGRRKRRLEEMTHQEWDIALAVLDANGRWEEMWRLAKEGPHEWSRKFLERLGAAKWRPDDEEERDICEELIRLAERSEKTDLRSLVSCIAVLEGFKGTIDCLTISFDGRIAAVGCNRGTPEIVVWSLPDGALDDRDIDLVTQEKKEIIRESEALEFHAVTETPDDIGGLGILKDWLRLREKAFTKEARDYGLPAPKGIALIGIPGTGKSLTAKMIGGLWRLPLLRLDVGALFGSLVGEAEERTRRALKLAETVAPCIVWIDEFTSDDISAALKRQVPLSVSQRETIEALRAWLREGRAQSASFQELVEAEKQFVPLQINLVN